MSTAFTEAFQLVHQQEQMSRYRLESTWNKFFPAVMPREVILDPNEPSIFAVVPCSELSFNAPMYSFYYDNEIHVIPNYYHF